MGYYTEYELEVDDGNLQEHVDEITLSSGYAELFGGDTIKWYKHEEQMRKHSKKHPNTLFTLSGEGEESGDLWVEYYKNGKAQIVKARIEFDPYNESALG